MHDHHTHDDTMDLTASEPLRSGLGTTSFVCGVIGVFTGCFPVMGLVAVVLGGVALVRIRLNPQRYGGRGDAIRGIIAGLLSLCVVCPIFFVALERARELSKRAVCAVNMAGIDKLMREYVADNANAYPPDLVTLVKLGKLAPGLLICPMSGEESDDLLDLMRSYKLGDDPAETVLRSCYGYLEGQTLNSNSRNVVMFEKRHCHGDEGGYVLFADGRVEFVTPYDKIEQWVAETRRRIAEDQATRTP